MGADRSRVVYRALLALAVAAGWIAAFRWPHSPLLSWWLFCALAFGTYIAFTGTEDGLAARATRLVLLHAALLPSALGSTQLAARRVTAATHLRYHGILVERARSITVGSGVDDADVVLPTLSSSQTPWRLVLLRGKSGWTVGPKSDAEQIRYAPVRDYRPTFLQRVAEWTRLKRRPVTMANAALLLPRGPTAVVRDSSGAVVDIFELVTENERLTLRSRTIGVTLLDPIDEGFAARYRRMLAAGTNLAALDAHRAAGVGRSIPLDRLVRIQELGTSRHVNGDWSPPIPWRSKDRRFLLSVSAPFTVRESGAAPGTPAQALGDSTRVEVRHGGGVWRFDVLTVQRTRASDSAVAIRFVTTPRVLDVPLPTAGECRDGVACGVLSLRPLPPPIAHFSLAGAGLDTSRFAFLATVRRAASGFVLAMGQQEISILPADGIKPVPVDAVEMEDGSPRRPTAKPSRWLLLSASNSALNGLWQLAFVALGLVALLLTVHELVRGTGGASVRGGAVTESAIALGLCALLALLTTRVVVGARVTFFPPENPAGLDTAIGMFVAMAIATLGLMLWDRWVPLALGGIQAFVCAPSGATRAWWTRVSSDYRSEVGARRRRRTHLRWVLPFLALSIILLAIVSRTAVGMGLAAGSLVLSVWFLLAWISAFGGQEFHTFAESPCDVIERDAAEEPGSRDAVLQLVRLCLQWALVLSSPLAGLLVCAVTCFPYDAWQIWRARRADGAKGAAMPRALVSLASLTSTLVIALLRIQSENGAMASFLLVILVALTSVRIGRSLAAHLARQEVGVDATGAPSLPAHYTPAVGHVAFAGEPSARVSRWSVILYLLAPILLLAPLAVIDMGLLLVTVLPIGAASLLAVGWRHVDRVGRTAATAAAGVLALFLVFKVLFPPLGAIADPSASYVARADAYDRMQRIFGVRVPFAPVQASLERTAARAVATRDQQAAELLLIAARPGNGRDLLMPSIEQVWGGRAYSASGVTGHGQGSAPVAGHGIAEPVSYAENSFAVYVLYEHGALGGILLLGAYLVFTWAALVAMRNSVSLRLQPGLSGASLRASRALFLVAALLVAIPAAYVALSNLGVVPITGQNMPFLGLNAWSDVTLGAGVFGMLLTAAIRTQAVQRRSA